MTSVYNLLRESCGISQAEAADRVHETRLDTVKSWSSDRRPAPGWAINQLQSLSRRIRRAGEAYAAGNMNKALGYYQDALTACPSSSKAAVNLARTFETMNNRSAAIRYYRQAAASTESDPHSIQDAKAALSRLGEN